MLSSSGDLPALIRDLSAAVGAAGGVLDGAVYAQARRLFAATENDAGLAAALTAAAPEYPRAEYLACPDAGGRVAATASEVVEDFRETERRAAGFGRWFRPATTAEGEPVLLVARWLCHLAGLRHPTVQLFLDLPDWPGATLVQVRGLGRPVAPGNFDLPVAGHVAGLTPPAAALAEEMAQELGLAGDQVTALASLGQYEHHAETGGLDDREYRFVFCGRLVPGALSGLRFVDGEVAAVAVFAVAELQMLLARFPERVASGLAASLPLYLAAGLPQGPTIRRHTKV